MKNATVAIAGALAGATVTLLCIVVFEFGRRRTAKLVFTEAAQITRDKALRIRHEHFCAAQSVSYANTSPLMIMKGQGQYLYDEQGIAYLDTRNNVPHVGCVAWATMEQLLLHATLPRKKSPCGYSTLVSNNTYFLCYASLRHCHPKVVAAVQKQVAALNTNTRYHCALRHPETLTLWPVCGLSRRVFAITRKPGCPGTFTRWCACWLRSLWRPCPRGSTRASSSTRAARLTVRASVCLACLIFHI
jgi:hypothetical protein